MSLNMWRFIYVTIFILAAFAQTAENPPYIKQCSRSDPQLLDCLRDALHHLRPYLATGIPEIEMPSVEPFVMDNLALQLTGGPQGYRVNLKNMEVYGASNFTVKSIKLSENNKPFEARIALPKLVIKAKYFSSGVLIIIPASGSGDFAGAFDGVVADIRGTVSTEPRPEGTFMRVETLGLELTIKKVRLSVSKVFNNNRILTEATNLFLRENGHEVVKAMQPQLQKKLSIEFMRIANQLVKHVPIEQFLRD
ncbi:uncharacterized protein LOC132256648 [Phlebotomus argentipes]|uniref:uncharacterized protein LOC132256648 n=1 Tax=Phlebotomus argentipes TaxID=94469 RepID=UPI002892A396|nr:uncharacterized protein LOC132256648 [Phlebotomus argentipes]